MYHYREAHCHRCDCNRHFRKRRIDHGAHCAASIFTFGLWLVGWVALTIHRQRKPWRCSRCGARLRVAIQEAARPQETVPVAIRVPEMTTPAGVS
jgi:hypothetical protein